MESTAEFAIPIVVTEKLMNRKDKPTKENVIFNIDIPYVTKKGKKEFVSMEVFIEGFSRSEYAYEQISFGNIT